MGRIITMVALISIVDWAIEQACSLLEPLEQRWMHVQGVAKKAKQVSTILDKDDQEILIAVAYLHDIGYAPSLQKTGFHPLDVAYYLQGLKEDRLASLVAYHSGAQFEARLRGLTLELNQFCREQSIVADALDYCDMTTNSTGLQVTFQERIDDIFSRYDKTHIVNKAIHQAIPSLSLAVERTKEAFYKHDTPTNN